MIITTVAGNVGKDAIAKSTQDGTPLCSFPVAASIGFGDRKQTIWFDVTKWGKGADKLATYLLKGAKVSVSGELSTREHEGKTYLQIRADYVTLQGGRGDAPAKQEPAGGFGDGFGDDLDDKCPF